MHRSFKTKEVGINGSTTIAPQIIVPWIIAPKKNFPPDNCPLTINFPSKIIAPTQANTSQRVLWVNWGKLCIVSSTIIYKYCKLRVKSDLLPYIFTDLILILLNNTYKRTTFTKCLLILLHQHAKKIQFFGKNWFRKKYKKYS